MATHDNTGTPAGLAAASETLYDVPVAVWKSLVAAADLCRRVAPWNVFSRGEFFGIRPDDHWPIAFVTFLGSKTPAYQTCFAFLGWEAFAAMRSAILAGSLSVRALLETNALHFAIVTGKELSPADHDVLRTAGNWPEPETGLLPVFRSHCPGFLPWLPNADEAAHMAEICRQIAGVAMRRESSPGLPEPPAPGLVWVRSRNVRGQWVEGWLPIPPGKTPESQVDAGKLAQVQALPRHQTRMQFDLSMSEATIGNKGSRLRTTYLLAAFDSDDGKCLGADVLVVSEGLQALWLSVPNRLLNLLLHSGSLPREIEVGSIHMMETLRPLLGRLPIKLTLRERLPHFQTFLEGMNKVNSREEQ